MANKYAKEFRIPPGFAEILRDFAREVIRDQPENINAYGFQYFTDKMMSGKDLPEVPVVGGVESQRKISVKMHETGQVLHEDSGNVMSRQGSGVGEDPNRVSNEELYDRISLLFDQADADGNGTLERREMEVIFTMLAEDLGLTEKDVMLILSEADENDDGVIEYREFVPMAVDIITALIAKEQFQANKELRSTNKGAEEAREYLLKGMPQQELEQSIREVFQNADDDGNGHLDRAEFLRCLKESGLGFTRREINIILTMVDRNGDGLIQYEEFIPICLSMLVEIVAHQLQETPQDEAALTSLIFEEFQNTARAEDNMIYFKDAMMTLERLDLGLTKVQIHAIMSSVEEDETGMVPMDMLAECAAGVIVSLSEWSSKGTKAKQLLDMHNKESYRLVMGINQEGFQTTLIGAFQSADAGNTGVVPRKLVRSIIESSLPSLSQHQVQALMSIGHPDENGDVAYDDIISLGFQTLQSLRTQQALKEAHSSGADLEATLQKHDSM